MILSFKNRIAFYYMLATAMVITLVFFVIYWVVYTAVYRELDNDLAYEAHKHTREIFIINDSILFVNKKEWAEREHVAVQVNPVFIQIVDTKGRLMDKSPNLKEGALIFHSDKKSDTHFDTKLNNAAIRQVQIPIEQHGVFKGYILTAMSQEGALVVLNSLKNTLLLLFPIVLFGLFFITRFLAGRSIIPVKTITHTTGVISRNNLNERVPLPQNKDELHTLAASINELLDRIQSAMERERQFTADASHQLRTPLAVLKGTLEVLIRKPRTEEEYQQKIQFSIDEIDRITKIVNQLLILARFDKTNLKLAKQELDLRIAIDNVLQRFKSSIQQKNLSVNITTDTSASLVTDPYYVDLILENIISNAIKYAPVNGKIEVFILSKSEEIICKIKDNGIGIQTPDLENIFNPFFRSDEFSHSEIKGTGLGLSITKKASQVLNARVEVESEVSVGTVFSIYFSRF
jgi:two-component system heavy metal sensor histidine kinase CusS